MKEVKDEHGELKKCCVS